MTRLGRGAKLQFAYTKPQQNIAMEMKQVLYETFLGNLSQRPRALLMRLSG